MSRANRNSWAATARLFLSVVLSRASKGSIYDRLSNLAPLFSAQRWTCRYPVLYAFWRELRSVPLRILERHRAGVSYEGLDVRRIGEECQPSTTLYQARIQGIQNLRIRLPWITLFDELLYLEGLNDGLRSHSHSANKAESQLS
jgi:hypothetical protein